MKIIKGLLFFFITLILGIGQTFSQEYQQSLDMRVPYTPDFVNIDGKPTVYYELYLTNFASDSIDLKMLEVIDADDSTVFVSFNKDDLKKRYSRIGVSQKDNGITLPPGGSSVIYIEFTLQYDKSNMKIAHRIEFETLDSNGENFRSVQGAFASLSEKTQIVLGPPLGIGFWAAVYDPSWERGHRRVIYTVNGKVRIPGRFAIDFIRLDDKGRYADGDNNVIRDYAVELSV